MEASKFWKQGTSVVLKHFLPFVHSAGIHDWLDYKASLTMTFIPSWSASVEYLQMFKFSNLVFYLDFQNMNDMEEP